MNDICNMKTLQDKLIGKYPECETIINEFVITKITDNINKTFGNSKKLFVVVEKDDVYITKKDYTEYINEFQQLKEQKEVGK